MKIGERVRHRDSKDAGIGNITEIYEDGRCDAVFPNCKFTWVLLEKFISVEEEERRLAEEEYLKREAAELLSKGLDQIREQLQKNFLGADEMFSLSMPKGVSAKDYQNEKVAFVKNWVYEHCQTSPTGVARVPDDEQALAISAVHGHVQVVARAGSGKTSTLVNRALFLIRHCGIAPHEIMLLAFNRKAAQEIRSRFLRLMHPEADAAIEVEMLRVNRASVSAGSRITFANEASVVSTVATKLNVELPHVMTFHALAHAIVHPESILFDGSEGEAQRLSRVTQQVIDDHLKIPELKEQIRELMMIHFREDWDRIISGLYDKSKAEFLEFRRSLPRESLSGDYVKSYGEKLIADFLFEHDVSYKYERSHFWKNINYHPDFTIFKTERSGVIIEYFGLSGDPDYDDMSKEKRRYWANKEGWILLDYAPTDIVAGGAESFLVRVKANLERLGITCKRLTEDEIWQRIRDRAIDRFTTATVGFIGRCRKQSLSPGQLQQLIDQFVPLSAVEMQFLQIAHRLYTAYLQRLASTGEDDFDGMMQRAADVIENGNTRFERKSGNGDLAALRYVFIDEYQDFSNLFYRLLSAIRTQCPQLELFCVGDDWQAINGFAGSDLKYFERFSKYIEDAKTLDISTNYRSARKIVNIGNALMQGLGKPAKAHRKVEGRVHVADVNDFTPISIERQRHPGDLITPVTLRVVNKALADGMDVVMLCRRNGLPWFVNYGKKDGTEGRGLERYLQFIRSYFPKDLRNRITISTAHRYKGLENSCVIVMDAVARSYPLIHPDWAFSRILGDNPGSISKEERRLFYVALTRPTDTLVVLTDGRSKSPFLEEILRRFESDPIVWDNYPPVKSDVARLVVKIGNQPGRRSEPTFSIRHLLDGCRYRWDSTGWPGWAKSFPGEGFSIDLVKQEIWAQSADGIEVRVLDEAEILKERYFVDNLIWTTASSDL